MAPEAAVALPRSDSVALWLETIGDCDCGVVRPIGQPGNDHQHSLMSDLGRIEYPNARPDRGEIGPLMLAPKEWVDDLLENGAHMYCRDPARTKWSATQNGGRLFMRVEYWPDRWDSRYQSWTWELRDAHWTDSEPCSTFVGCWPD